MIKAHKIFGPNYFADFYALIAGLMLPFAFAPFNVFPLAIISPALLLWLWLYVQPKRALLRGLLYGIGAFGIGVSWVYVSIHTYGQASVILAGVITALFVLILACFPAAQGYLLRRFFARNYTSKLLLAFPLSWVMFEWLRSWLLSGFPWLLLGYSQVNTVLHGYAPIGSVYLISFMVAVTAAAIVAFFELTKFKQRLLTVLIIIAVWGCGFLLSTVHWGNASGRPITVSVVQGDIPQHLKWKESDVANVLYTYWELTTPYWKSNLIVWPEAAITITQKQAKKFLNDITQKTIPNNSALITGIPIEQGMNIYNGMIVLGNGHGTYLKRHLVPFGEYMPWRGILAPLLSSVKIPMSDLSSGPNKQPNMIANHLKIAAFICYEIAFPREVRKALNKANLIVNVSDDSWFGKSIAASQQLQMAQMRAQETARYVISSTNSGITAIINPRGQVTARLPMFTRAVLTSTVQPMTGRTLWVFLGFYPFLIILFVLLQVAWMRQKL